MTLFDHFIKSHTVITWFVLEPNILYEIIPPVLYKLDNRVENYIRFFPFGFLLGDFIGREGDTITIYDKKDHFYYHQRSESFWEKKQVQTGAYIGRYRVFGSCRPAIFNLVIVQFFRKKIAVVQFQIRFFITWKYRKLAMFYFWNTGNLASD